MRQVKKKKKSSAKKQIKWLIGLVLIGGCAWFWQSDYRTVLMERVRESYVEVMKKTHLVLEQAKVQGHIRTETNDILQVTDLSLGMAIFDVDLEQIHEEISRLPWVKSVMIERQLPSSLLITVTEKTPIAMWQNNKKYMPLDEEGTPIPDEQTKLSGLILVVGADAPQHTLALLEMLKRYPSVEEKVRSAVRVGNRRWDLILNDVDGLTVNLPAENVEQALALLQNSIEKEKLLEKDLKSINLKQPDRVVVTLRENKK